MSERSPIDTQGTRSTTKHVPLLSLYGAQNADENTRFLVALLRHFHAFECVRDDEPPCRSMTCGSVAVIDKFRCRRGRPSDTGRQRRAPTRPMRCRCAQTDTKASLLRSEPSCAWRCPLQTLRIWNASKARAVAPGGPVHRRGLTSGRATARIFKMGFASQSRNPDNYLPPPAVRARTPWSTW